LTGTTLIASGLTTSGSWIGGGICAVNTGVAYNDHQSDVIVTNLNNLSAITNIRVYKHRSVGFCGDGLDTCGYFSGQGVISMDGTQVCANTTGGVPDYLAVTCALTGYSPPGSTRGGSIFGGKSTLGGTGRVQ
jgi:hypothetical protein